MTPLVCFVGPSNIGKTTLLEQIAAELKSRGYRVGAIKHAAHGFEMDRPGKDSWRLARAGCEAVVVSSPNRLALIQQVPCEPSLDEVASMLEGQVDIILVEGYGESGRPRIEVSRSAIDRRLTSKPEELLAVVSDHRASRDVLQFGLAEVDALVDFLVEHAGVTRFGVDDGSR